jgi:hypothetical protein
MRSIIGEGCQGLQQPLDLKRATHAEASIGTICIPRLRHAVGAYLAGMLFVFTKAILFGSTGVLARQASGRCVREGLLPSRREAVSAARCAPPSH